MSIKHTFKALHCKVGNAARKLVLIKLADNANDEGMCYPSRKTIAKLCEMSDRSVDKHLKALQEMGLITIKQRCCKERGKLSNVYYLHLENAEMIDLPPSENISPPPSEKNDKPLAKKTTDPSEKSSHRTCQRTCQKEPVRKGEKNLKIEMVQINQKVNMPVLAYENLQSEFGKLVVDGYAGLINQWLLENPNGIKKSEYKNYAKAIRDWIARDKKKGWFESTVAKFTTPHTVCLDNLDWREKANVLSDGGKTGASGSSWWAMHGESDQEWANRVYSWLKFGLDKHWDIEHQRWKMDTPEQKQQVLNLHSKARAFQQGRGK